jgi:phosphatidylserine decarboxylase
MIRRRAFVWLQYALPKRAMSRIVWRITRVRHSAFKNWLIRSFVRAYGIDMREAAEPDYTRYASFNEFFTRELRPGVRAIAAGDTVIVSPADGRISECGRIDGDRLLQAKGFDYSVKDLLGGAHSAETFHSGNFLTIYLAPYNYHRVHMPLAGRLRSSVLLRGSLFSVNAVTASQVPRLFARNERLVSVFDTNAGALALVMVGALHVSSISTVWGSSPVVGLALAKGAEMGRFNMGSTVIMLFERGRSTLAAGLRAEQPVRLGESLGTVVHSE